MPFAPISRLRRLAGTMAVLTTLLLAAAPAAAQEMEIGMREFHQRCAVCRGLQGEGDGPMTQILKQAPVDLRHLARDNDGVFPFARVYQSIDGRREIRGHGTTDMPVWGDYFSEETVGAGLPSGLDARQIIQGRILSLVYYLQAIQEK